MVRIARRSLSCIASAYLILCAALGVLLAEGALHPPGWRVASVHRERLVNGLSGVAQIEDVELAASDGVMLRGWWIHPSAPNGSMVIAWHGVGDNRHGVAGLADLLARHGYDVLALDSRAHGASGGHASYGIRERTDAAAWITWFEGRAPTPPDCVFGVGQSMGAAILLQASSDPRFCGLVLEAPFATFREVAYDRFGQRLGLGPWVGRWALRPAIEAGFLFTRWRFGLNLDDARPVDLVAGHGPPILLIHGTEDRNIPERHAQWLREANTGRVTLWLVPGASHAGAWRAAPSAFRTRVLAFLAANRTARPSDIGRAAPGAPPVPRTP
jgi:uncharacterized protein